MSDSVSNVTEVEAVTEEETVTEVEAVSEAEDNSLVPIITEVGIQAIIAALREEKSVKITEIALGSGIDDAGYQSDSSAIALETEKQRVPVSNAETIGESQLHITANITGPEEYWVREVGFYLEDGTLLAIYASEGEAMAYKGRDVDLFIGFDLSLNALPADSVTVDTSTDINVAINSHSLDGINGGPRDALYVDHDGKVGIGTKEPGASLDVVGDIHTSDKLTIDTDVFVRGKIGVGTDLPEADLHVEGNVQTESLSVTGQT
ncbi:MAG: phage tail protein, partial [Gammaproteobacteria bacterium]|nr:phage tail protein [Gammaproteobacteria bacterium]NNJ84481.1 hypothetical protein [Gammaproteobacteria bacterium]